MCQTYFSGLWVGTTPDQSYLRNRVVWCTKRTPGDERAFPRQFARHRMNLGRFQALGQRQRRQDGRQALCIMDFPLPGGPIIMTLCPPPPRPQAPVSTLLLAFHIRKVKIKLCLLGIKLSPRIYFGRHQAPSSFKKRTTSPIWLAPYTLSRLTTAASRTFCLGTIKCSKPISRALML